MNQKLDSNKVLNKEKKLLAFKIHLYLDEIFMEQIKTAIHSKQDTGDYQFSNPSEFLRLSLLDFKNNKNLDFDYLTYAVDRDATKKRYSFRISKEIKDILSTFKDREVSEIVEKILGTYKQETIG